MVGPVGPKEQKGPGVGTVKVPGVKVWTGVLVSKGEAEGRRKRRRREVRVERRRYGIFGGLGMVVVVVVVVEGG